METTITEPMRIGALAARTGASVRALRYYEQCGLLAAMRSAAGQRYYDPAAVGRVTLIRQLFRAGLSSRTIAELLPCVEAAGRGETAHEHGILFRERDRIDAEIAELVRTRDVLSDVIAAAATCAAAAAAREAG